jgi:ribosomal protein S4
MDIPSYLVEPGDVIAWKRVGGNGSIPQFIQELTDGLPKRPIPPWLRLDIANLIGEVASLPDMSEIDSAIDARLVVEFYSK